MKWSFGETLSGPAGTAKSLEFIHDINDRPDWQATLSVWLLDCPGQSLAWSHFVLSTIHLRPIENVRPAVLRFPEATHEILLLALDPESPIDPNVWRFLRPANLVHQVVLPSDEDAVDLLRQAVLAVTDNRLWAEPPLSGQKEPWVSFLDRRARRLRGEP